MLDKDEYYKEINELIPCQEHAIKLADLLMKLLHECIIHSCDKEILYLISKKEVVLRQSLQDIRNSNLNNYQLTVFNEVQKEILEFLKKNQKLQI